MQHRIYLLLLIFWRCLQSIEFVVVPDYPPCVENLFVDGEVTNYIEASVWNKIKYLLNQEGHSVSAAYFSDLPLINKGKHIIVWNHLGEEATLQLKQIKPKYLSVIIYEPPSVLQHIHTDKYNSLFSRVITWDDDKVDGAKFVKFYYPFCSQMIKDVVPFSERKLCTLIAANKESNFRGEIYSERKRAILYFNTFPDQFDFYGPGWKKMKLQTYKGVVDSKIDALKRYKFSICYENTQGMNGYITEKIFDCFQAGVVPVYLGASNISDEIPSNCFIDKRNFKSYKKLHDYLLAITEEEFNCYLDNIRTFLVSDKAKDYTPDSFALSVVNALTGLKLTRDDLPR